MTASPSLGRGLSALLSQNQEKEFSSDGHQNTGKLISINPSQITPGKFQPRGYFDTEKLKELSTSISKQGVLQPILVRPLQKNIYAYEIVAGERRWQAAKMAKLEEIPVMVCHLSDQEALEVALIENIQRADLNALEEAEGYKRLMDEFGYTQEALSKSIGKSRSQVANTLRLLNLPDKIKQHIQKNSITAGHARALLKAENPEGLVQEILSKSLSVRETEDRVSSEKKQTKNSVHSVENSDIQYLEEELRQKLSANVELREKGKGAILKINFKSLETLDDFIQKVCT